MVLESAEAPVRAVIDTLYASIRHVNLKKYFALKSLKALPGLIGDNCDAQSKIVQQSDAIRDAEKALIASA
jgi:hypothetical protein